MKQTKTAQTQLAKMIQTIATLAKQAFAGVLIEEHFNWQAEFDGPRHIEQLRVERELSKLTSSGWGRTGSDGI